MEKNSFSPTRLLAAAVALALPLTAEAGLVSQREVIATVLRENPAIKAARAKWEMMKARVPQAAAWEDLRFSFDSVTARTVGIPPESFMDQTAILEQEVPISGKNRSRARAVTAEAGAQFEDLRRVELDTVARARTAYARLANGYAQLEVNDRNQDLIGQFVQISRSRYESGAATQADLLIAQTDEAKLAETRAEVERQISDAQSALNVLLNRPAQSPFGQPQQLTFVARPLSLQRLQAVAMARRPELQRAQNRIDAEKFRVELANRQWFPDPALNVKSQRYNESSKGISEVDIGISMPIPWLNHKKYSAGILEARKSLEAAQQEFEAAHTETLGLVRDQLKKIQTLATQYELYRDKILPVARQTVEASRSGYEASTGGFLELITTRRTLQDVESTALNHLADYEAALAELDAMIGAGTPALQKGSYK